MMSGVNQRERGGNRRGNRRSAPSGGFRNNRLQQQLPQQPIIAQFSHDSGSNYVNISGNQHPFVGQFTHPTIINGRPNMNVPTQPLTYPFLPQNIQPNNGTTLTYIAQPQFLSSQLSGMRYNGTYQSFLPTITIPQNNQSLSGSQVPIQIQGFQSYHNNHSPYTTNIPGVTLNQQYSSNHSQYSNTPPPPPSSYGTIPPVGNFQHLQSVVAVHSLPSLISPFPGMVSQNVVPFNNSILHPLTTTLRTIPHELNDITTLGGVQFSTPGQNSDKKDETKREKREKVPLKILDPNTNEEIIDTPPEVIKVKCDDIPEVPIINTNNLQPKMFVIHSPVMVQNPILLPGQQMINQSPIISNGVHPIHFPIDNHQLIPNRNYVPNSQLQRSQSSINYLDAAIDNFYTRDYGNRNGIINNNSNNNNNNNSDNINNNSLSGGENIIRRRVIEDESISNIDSNNNKSTYDTNELSSNSNTQESIKNLSLNSNSNNNNINNNNNNNKYKKAGIVGSTPTTTTLCTNIIPNNLNDHSEESNDKNTSSPDTHIRCNGIKNKKIKKYKNNMKDGNSGGVVFSSSSNSSTYKGKNITYRSVSSSNGKRNLSSFKEKQSPIKNKQLMSNEDSSKFKIQNLLAYNFKSLTIRNVSLVSTGTKQIPIITGGCLNTNYKTSINEIFTTSHNEILTNENCYNDNTSMEQFLRCNKDSRKDDCIVEVFDDINMMYNEDESTNKNIYQCLDRNVEEGDEGEGEKMMLNNNIKDEKNSLHCEEKCIEKTCENQPTSSSIPPSEGILHTITTSINKLGVDIKNNEEEVVHEHRRKKDKKNRGQNKGNGDKYNNQCRKKR